MAAGNVLRSSLISTPVFKEFEDVWVRLDALGTNLVIGCVYIPPNSAVDVYRSFSSTCEALRNKFSNHKFLIYGDFNLPHIRWIHEDGTLVPSNVNQTAESLIDTMYFLELQQINQIHNASGKLLDLIFADDFDKTAVTRSSVSILPIDPHHPATETTLNLQFINKLVSHNATTVYQFRHADYISLNRYLSNTDWSFICCTESVESVVCQFYDILYDAVHQCVPREARKTDKYPKWFSSDLRKSITLKNKAYKRYMETRTPSDYNAYSNIRREVKAMTDTCYLLYVTNTEHLIPENIKHFWSFINNLKRDSGFPVQMQHNGKTMTKPEDIAEAFATHFQSTYTDKPILDFNRIDPVGFAGVLATHIFTTEEICDKLKRLDTSKRAGPDGVPPIMLKNCATSLAFPLRQLFQRSMDGGLFPAAWKLSFLLPIFKSGDKCDIENYRGISILSAIPKLFESILTDEIFTTYSRYINSVQHGFYRGRSTATNLAVYQNFLVTSVEQGHQVDSIYTDLSKAFDSVNHRLLLKKLSEIGVIGDYLRWIQSYLGDRRQRVDVSGTLSSEVMVTSGVPQGSHLGPVLFLLFINDVTSCFSSSHVLLYADDLKFYNRVSVDHNQLQDDLDRFVSWCSLNHLKINVPKCKSISFHRCDNQIVRNYTINNQLLTSVDSFNDLGVVFQKDLSFNLHVESVAVRGFRMLGFIKRNSKHIMDTKAVCCLYYSLVRSTLEYCSTIWTPKYTIHKSRLEAIQNKFTKYLLYKHHFPSDGLTYETRLMLCGLKSLEHRRREAMFVFLYKLCNGMIDCDTLLGLLRLKVPLRRTRQHKLFYEGQHRTNYGETAFIDRLVVNYNRFYCDCDIFNYSLSQIRNMIMFM